MASTDLAIGIDLGTTYTCAGVWRRGHVEIIVNPQGNRVTPSCVAFRDSERLIGDGAAYQAIRNLTNTIFDVKRLIGRKYKEESVQSDMKLWPFKIVEESGRPKIVAQYMGKEKHFSPEEISSLVLGTMKESAEKFLGMKVNKAVVTVPAYFNNSQRQATKDAGAIAGLDVIQILNEPTAAALAYGLGNKDAICKDGKKKKILVFDLGGGTFDVSLLELDQHGVLEVKSTCGDTHLGGQDFDNRMVTHLLEVFKQKHKKDIGNNAKCIGRLKAKCERAKRDLSFTELTEINIDNLFEDIDFSRKITRAKFEELNDDLFRKCLVPLKQCLDDAKVEKKDVDEVVLVGGSTRIPKIQQLLSEFFDGKQLNNQLHADEAVAIGASIQAAILNGHADRKGLDVVLLDVTPLSLGMEESKGLSVVFIKRNSRIPCTVEQRWCTAKDYQTKASFEIYEGERPLAADNNFLGDFTLTGIRPAPKGEINFLVVFRIDENGILHVTARNNDSGDTGNISITRDKLTLNKDDIDRMIRESREMEHDDRERKKAVLARHELEEYILKIKRLIKGSSVASKLKKESMSRLTSELDRVNHWLEENEGAAYYDIDFQKALLMKTWEPIKVKLETAGFKNLRI